MDEVVVDNEAKTTPITEVVEPQEKAITEPTPKKGGRPAGAKDKAPRKKKVVVVAEDLPESRTEPEKRARAKSVTAASSSAAPEPEPLRAPEFVRAPEPVREEPPSPRSIIRQSANHMLELKRLNMQARKNHLGSTYTRGLASF